MIKYIFSQEDNPSRLMYSSMDVKLSTLIDNMAVDFHGIKEAFDQLSLEEKSVFLRGFYPIFNLGQRFRAQLKGLKNKSYFTDVPSGIFQYLAEHSLPATDAKVPHVLSQFMGQMEFSKDNVHIYPGNYNDFVDYFFQSDFYESIDEPIKGMIKNKKILTIPFTDDKLMSNFDFEIEYCPILEDYFLRHGNELGPHYSFFSLNEDISCPVQEFHNILKASIVQHAWWFLEYTGRITCFQDFTIIHTNIEEKDIFLQDLPSYTYAIQAFQQQNVIGDSLRERMETYCLCLNFFYDVLMSQWIQPHRNDFQRDFTTRVFQEIALLKDQVKNSNKTVKEVTHGYTW